MLDTADLARVSVTRPRSVIRWQTQETAPRRRAEERLLELRAMVDLARGLNTGRRPSLLGAFPNRLDDLPKPKTEPATHRNRLGQGRGFGAPCPWKALKDGVRAVTRGTHDRLGRTSDLPS